MSHSKTVKQGEQIFLYPAFCFNQASNRLDEPTHIGEGNLLYLVY